MGLEPTTLRCLRLASWKLAVYLRVSCSTDWANRAWLPSSWSISIKANWPFTAQFRVYLQQRWTLLWQVVGESQNCQMSWASDEANSSSSKHRPRDSSVGRAEDCRWFILTSLGRWFKSGSRDGMFSDYAAPNHTDTHSWCKASPKAVNLELWMTNPQTR